MNIEQLGLTMREKPWNKFCIDIEIKKASHVGGSSLMPICTRPAQIGPMGNRTRDGAFT
jgi:hypothetical protein